MDERQLVGEARIAGVAQLRIEVERELLRRADDPPDRAHRLGEVHEGALLGRDRPLPVPLVDVGGVVVVEEVVLADGAHVGDEPLAGLHAELAERHSLPLRRGLDHLGVDRVLLVVVRNPEAHGRSGAVTVEVVVDAARRVDDQRHLDADQVELAAQTVLDVTLHGRKRALCLVRVQQRRVVPRQDLLELGIVADPRACEVSRLVDARHGALQSLDGTRPTLVGRAATNIRRGRQPTYGELRSTLPSRAGCA